MNEFTVDNSWDAIKGRLRQRYTHLSDEDVAFEEGKGDELFARLREKIGLSDANLHALLHDVKAEVNGRFEQAKAKVSGVAAESYDQARRRVRTLGEDAEEYVRQHPYESLLAAVCAGFVAGLLIRRQ